MYPQKIDALFYAHSLDEVKALAPLLERFRSTVSKKAYIAVSGGNFCPCEDAAAALNWPKLVCKERWFKNFDLGVGSITGISNSEVPILQSVYSSMKGLIKIHNPSLLITVTDIDLNIKNALKMAVGSNSNHLTLVLLPRSAVPRFCGWMIWDQQHCQVRNTIISFAMFFSLVMKNLGTWRSAIAILILQYVASSLRHDTITIFTTFPFITIQAVAIILCWLEWNANFHKHHHPKPRFIPLKASQISHWSLLS